MQAFAYLFKNENLQGFQAVAQTPVLKSIENAAKKTGVDFAYLVEQAATESGFNPKAKAKTSSATGLYQFIEGTWLSMIKKYGDEFGLSQQAQQIQIDQKGKYYVANPQTKEEILALRTDPDIASTMAAKLAQSNERYLKHHVKGIDIGKTELYLAHFMGANGAARFLNEMKNNEEIMAAQVFKKEAKVNKNVFYDQNTGTARSLKDVYAFFDKKFHEPSHQQDTTIKIAKTEELETLAFDKSSKRPFPTSQNQTNSWDKISNPFGFTQRLSAKNLFLISQITSDMDSLLFRDKKNFV